MRTVFQVDFRRFLRFEFLEPRMVFSADMYEVPLLDSDPQSGYECESTEGGTFGGIGGNSSGCSACGGSGCSYCGSGIEYPVEPSSEYHDDGTLRFDQNGLAYYFDRVDDAILGLDKNPLSAPPLPSGGPSLEDPSSGLDVPVYHSNSSYPKKIYLDFDGQMVSGTPRAIACRSTCDCPG